MFRQRSKDLVWIAVSIIALVSLVFLGTACKSAPKIVGTWEGENGSSLEFFKDGTFVAKGGLLPISGDYSVLDNQQLRMDMGGLWGIAGPQVLGYRVSGKTLTLTDSLGNSVEMTRTK